MTAITIAAFDFDATLTRRDSVVPFLRRVAGTGRLVGGLASRPHRVIPAAARRDRDALRAVASEIGLGGVRRDDLERHAADLAGWIVERGLRDDTAARLGWHRRQGHRTVIVTASYEQYVRVVGDHLGVDQVLATRLEFDRSGRCTGRLLGANCRGDEKVRRLSAWIQSIGVDRSEATIWAYGDSNGDRPMLAFADHPVWVTEPLASVAPTV
jgi:phosphatidylglycerophosphatase C